MTPTPLDTSPLPTPAPRRTWKRGMGSVRKKGQDFYIRYCVAGKRYEEKVEAKTKTEAQAFLKAKLAQIDRGEFRADGLKLRVRDMYQLIFDDYLVEGQRTQDLPQRWKHLEPVFGSMKARDVRSSAITKYCKNRLKNGATPATVQREVSCLRRMFRLALKDELLSSIPGFPQVEEDGVNARQGFFEDEDFYKVLPFLPSHLQVLATVAFWVGARKGELCLVQWRHIDLNTGKVSLPAGFCKSKKARSFFLPSEALEAVRNWRQTTREFELKNQTVVPTVFHRNGKPIKKFTAAWNKAFVVAGVERRLFHDLRRTAAKNYVDSGTPKTTVMSITGHLTQKIFERYNIRDTDRDQQDAAQAISRRVVRSRTGAVMGNGELRESV